MGDNFYQKARGFEITIRAKLNEKYKNELTDDILGYFIIHHRHAPERGAFLEFYAGKELPAYIKQEVDELFADYFWDL